MNPRALLMVALLVSPAWSQEPAATTATPAAQPFDLHGDAVKKIVRDTAASQFAAVQVSAKTPADATPAAFVYVPPEKPAEPVRELPQQSAAPAPKSNSFLSSMFEFLVDEALGGEIDVVTERNEILRCRVQKEQKTSPPGIDNCPSAD